MHNWFAIETEAEFRRREWQRASEAEARAAQASSGNGRTRWRRLPHLSLASLRALTAPRLPLTAPLAPRRRTAAW